MAEPAESRRIDGFPDRGSLRRALRQAIESALPELRVIAEGFLAEVSRTDLLGVGTEGELISIRVTEPGDDAAGLTRALADLSWLRPRRADFLKLAPGLGIEPAAEPRALIVARDFGPETLAAADNFPAATVQLWRLRRFDANGRPGLRIEAVAATPAQIVSVPLPPRRPERRIPLAGPPSPSAFRTGLVDADLEPEGRPEPATQPGVEPNTAAASPRSR